MPSVVLKLVNKYKMIIAAFCRREVRDKLDEGYLYQRDRPGFSADAFLEYIEREGADKK